MANEKRTGYKSREAVFGARFSVVALLSASYGHIGVRGSKLYRRFESRSLRHAVWTAENSRLLFPRIPQKMPVFRDFSSLKWTAENGLLGIKRVSIPAFLWTPHRQSGFADILRRTQCDHKSIT
jgi:hypothetical protein